MLYQKIHSLDDFRDVLEKSNSEIIAVFKHSSTCDLSAAAKTEMENITLPVYELTVQTARPLSNHIEDHFGIRHESPQVILIYQGKSIFNASHRNVQADRIHQAAHSLTTS